MNVRNDGRSRPKTSCCALMRLRQAAPPVVTCTAEHICCALAAARSTVTSCRGACKKKRTCRPNSLASVVAFPAHRKYGFAGVTSSGMGFVGSDGKFETCTCQAPEVRPAQSLQRIIRSVVSWLVVYVPLQQLGPDQEGPPLHSGGFMPHVYYLAALNHVLPIQHMFVVDTASAAQCSTCYSAAEHLC